mmetsp:Transcript_91471/g.267628  ORF Transcript_91471/g.267628 Transcript_91471/m.267628 type:complete len:245 (-) Transcript_91471:297-1031(-)
MRGLVEYSRPPNFAVHQSATALHRPRVLMSSFSVRRTSSSVISGDLSKSKPHKVLGGPRIARRTFGWLSSRTPHHQKSAFSFDVVWRKALKGRMSKSPSFSERISMGVAKSSAVWGRWRTCAPGARAVAAACATWEAGTTPLESMSLAKRSVRTITSFVPAGRWCLTARATGSSLSRPSGTPTTGKDRLFSARISSDSLTSLLDVSRSMPRSRPLRAAKSMGMMDPMPMTMTNASGATVARASL